MNLQVKDRPTTNFIAYSSTGAITLCALYVLVFARVKLFIYGSYDTAYYLQAFWRLAQFQLPTSTLNEFFPTTNPINIFMGHHFQYSALLFAPIFRLVPSPLIAGLFIVPGVTVVLTVLVWHKTFPKRSDLIPGILGLSLLFWSLYSGIFSSEFYLDKFVLPWVVASLYFFREKKAGWLIVSLIVVTGFKEYFALFSALACFVYWYKYRSRITLLACVIFLLYLPIVMIWIMPNFFDGDSLLFYHFGGNQGLTIVERAWYVFKNILFRWDSFLYLLLVFAQFLFLPLLSPEYALLSLPILAINLFSGTITKPYYAALPNTVLSVAFVYGLLYLRNRIHQRTKQQFLMGVITAVLIFTLFYSSILNILYRIKIDTQAFLSRPGYTVQLEKILAQMQKTDFVAVSPKLAPYVVQNQAFIFPKPFNQFDLADRVNKIIIAKHHPSYLDNFNGREVQFNETMSELINNYHFVRKMDTTDIIYLEKP